MNLVDFEIGARTLLGEARGEPEQGVIAVASVLVNRRQDGRWGKSLTSVCLWPMQFSCWMESDPNWGVCCDTSDEDGALQRMKSLLRTIALGDQADPTGGATHYYAKSLAHVPPWTVGAISCGQFGSQLFWKGVR